MRMTMQEALDDARRRDAAPRKPSDFEQISLLRSALMSGVRWKMDGEMCWCPCKRTAAWKAGTKQHTTFCRKAAEALQVTKR